MKELLGELMIHLEFAKLLGVFAAGAIVITVIAYFIFRKSRLIKYIPGVIMILIGIYNLFYLGRDASTLEGVNRLLIVMATMISGVIALSTGLIIGIVIKGRE